MRSATARKLGVATLAAVLAVWAAPSAQAVDDLMLNVAAGSESVTPGDTVTLTLDVANLSAPINGVQALIQYDDTVLALTSVVPTDLGLTLPDEGWVEVAFVDNFGDVTYAVVVNGDSVVADSTVATLTFTAIDEGVVSVTFRPGAAPFLTKLTVASDNSTVLPTTADSTDITSTCDDGVFCNGLETFDGLTCQPGTDPCAPLACDEVNDTCFAPVHVDGLELFYAGKFLNQADTSKAFLAPGSTATLGNVTNYTFGITGIRVFFDTLVDFATTAEAAFTFYWSDPPVCVGGTNNGQICNPEPSNPSIDPCILGGGVCNPNVFSPVTDAGTAISVTPSDVGGVTVVDIVLANDHVRQRWLEVTIDASQVTTTGVELDGEFVGNPVTFPSGDGTPGGDAVFYVGNMPGEVSGDRKTRLQDVGLVRLQVNPALLVPIDNVYDLDKSGKVQLTDAGLARLDVNPAFALPLISP